MRSALALLAALFFAAPSTLGAVRAQPAPEHELMVGNHGRRPIVELYASPTATDSWGEDRLGEQTLEPGRNVHVKLGRGRDCVFDVQAIYEDASREEQHGVDVCRGRGVTFDGTVTIAPQRIVSPTHDVVVANRAGRPIQQVLISPSDAGDWGDDRLGDTSISVGDTAHVHYRGSCVADIRVVFDNRSAEERRGVDFCVARRIAVQAGWTTADAVPTERQPGAEPVQLTVSNRSGHSATGLFLYPEGSADHGPDLLGGATLDDGAKIGIELLRPAGQCAFAAHVVYGGKLPDAEMGGLDLCRSLDVVLPGRA
jgi:hypothetical protein